MRCFFLRFSERLVERYSTLYQTGSNEGGQSRTGNFAKKWGFYQNFYTLAKGDITKFDIVTKLNIHECLTYLSYEKEKNEIEAEIIKKSYKK